MRQKHHTSNRREGAPIIAVARATECHSVVEGPAQHSALLENMSLFQTICPGCFWARDNRWLLSRVQRLAGPAGDRGFLSRLVPPTGTKLLDPLILFPLPPPSHSAHLFLLFLARERGILTHFFTTFVKIFDSLVHPSALMVWGLFFSSSFVCVAHFML